MDIHEITVEPFDLTISISRPQSIDQSINQYSFITGMPERRPSNRIIYKYNVTITIVGLVIGLVGLELTN